MNSWIKSTTASVALTLAGMLLAPPANAACTAQDSMSTGMVPALYFQGGDSRDGLLRVSDEDQAVIVGLWKVTFTAKGNKPPGPPDGAPIDAGYVTWHADGTELMNSGREPLTGSFCMGVWKQVGPSTFRLNHVALSWDSTGTVFIGPTSIRETVTVDGTGNHYTGAFSIVQYATDEKTVLGGVVGVVSAMRVNVN
jgi:hypothetical protein